MKSPFGSRGEGKLHDVALLTEFVENPFLKILKFRGSQIDGPLIVYVTIDSVLKAANRLNISCQLVNCPTKVGSRSPPSTASNVPCVQVQSLQSKYKHMTRRSHDAAYSLSPPLTLLSSSFDCFSRRSNRSKR